MISRDTNFEDKFLKDGILSKVYHTYISKHKNKFLI